MIIYEMKLPIISNVEKQKLVDISITNFIVTILITYSYS